ncbi:MAG: alpha/beta hydrolase [Flavobacteriales bacterium]|nr:MAG: alpha/beta hydrolase [Flavobacteriales bacterium]
MLKKIIKIVKWLIIIHLCFVVFAYFFQEKLIFYPSSLPSDYTFKFDRPFTEVNLKTADGENINALHFKLDSSKGVVLYFHGNSGNLSNWGNVVDYFSRYHYDVLVMDFRGYGKSTGSFNEELMYKDAQLCYDYLKKQYSESEIVIYGKSMGTTFATKVATDNHPKHLMLEVPFANLASAGRYRFPLLPMSLLKFNFETDKYISQVDCPITLFHGTEDLITSYDDSLELFRLANSENKEFITIPGGSHNNLVQYKLYQEVLSRRLE